MLPLTYWKNMNTALGQAATVTTKCGRDDGGPKMTSV
jgi:hypothetical protein